MRARLLIFGCLAVLGCSGGNGSDAAAAPDTLTRDQRDSIIGQSKLPGARGVSRARDVSKAADARAAAIDSLQQ